MQLLPLKAPGEDEYEKQEATVGLADVKASMQAFLSEMYGIFILKEEHKRLFFSGHVFTSFPFGLGETLVKHLAA